MRKAKSVATKEQPSVSRGTLALEAALSKRGWTQGELMRQLGCKPGMVNRWLHGYRSPGRDWAAKIEALLGIKATAWGEAPDAKLSKAG